MGIENLNYNQITKMEAEDQVEHAVEDVKATSEDAVNDVKNTVEDTKDDVDNI